MLFNRVGSSVRRGSDRPLHGVSDDGGEKINLPRSLLHNGVKPGDILSLTIEQDSASTRQVARDTRAVQNGLKKTAPGGDTCLL